MNHKASCGTPAATHWPAVSLVVLAGATAAIQVGKAAIAMPLLQRDLGLGLSALGGLTSVFAVLGLLGGMPAGVWASSTGARRVLLYGLWITILASACGAVSTSYLPLFLSRVMEGAGFLLITVAAPALLEKITTTSQRNLSFALWSCFMPTGMAIAMLLGPLFDDWRSIWWASTAATAAITFAVLALVPATKVHGRQSWSMHAAEVWQTLKSRMPLTLAASFALYSLMFFALFSFLPVLLMERMHVAYQTAGILCAVAVAANILGNLAAGVLLSQGISRSTLLAGASLAMGITGLGIFLPLLPHVLAFLLCITFSAVGGLIPATLLASAPLATPIATRVPLVLGLVMQGNNLGQLIGPVAVGSAIQLWGWGSAALVVSIAALLAAAIALGNRRR